MNINLLDAGFAVVLVLFFLRGALRGMVDETAGLIGVFLGFFLGARLYSFGVPWVQKALAATIYPGESNPLAPDAAAIVSYAVIFVLTLIAVSIVARLLKKFMQVTFTAWLNHVLGAVVGGGKGLLFCAVSLAAINKLAPNAPFIQGSVIAKHLEVLTAVARSFLPNFI